MIRGNQYSGVHVGGITSRAQTSIIYYVSNTGDDANNGLTVNTPWQTVSKVNATTLNPGEKVLFKKGETWREQLTVRGSGGILTPIVFDAYGVGADPIITGSNIMTGFSDTGSNQWDVALAADPLLTMFGTTRGTRVANKAAVIAANQWTWVAGTLTVYSVGDPSGTIQSGVRQRVLDTYVNLSQNVTFKNIIFEGCRDGVLAYLRHTTVTGINFLNCTIRNTGGEGLYFITTVGAMDNCSIRSCDIYGVWRNGIFNDPTLSVDLDNDMTVDSCNIYSNGLQPTTEYNGIFGQLSGWWITNNDIYDNGRWNILSHGIYSYGANGGGSSNIVHVDNNLCHDQPNGVGIRTRTSMIATNNTCYGNSSAGMSVGTNVAYDIVVHFGNNVIYDNATYGILVGAVAVGTVSLRLYHNTVVHVTGTEAALQIAQPLLEWTMKNNIFYTQSEYCVENNSTVASAWDIDYNYYYRVDDSFKFKWANVAKTFAEWQGAGIVNDANGYYADPVLTDVTDPTYDLHPSAGSPAGVKTGGLVVVGYTYDRDDVLYTATPSIGAYQY